MIYVDPAIWPFRGQLYCHMTADTAEELHEMADAIGLRRSWFQTKPGRPWMDHYDLAPSKRAAAVKLGAIEIDDHEAGLLQIWRRAMHATPERPVMWGVPR